MGWFTSFLYSQFFITPPIPTKDFSGQTIIVTGSNTGLGLEATQHLSRLNSQLLIIAVRNISKGEAAKRTILANTGRKESSIEVWELDMQSPISIQAFCKRAKALERLDAILENAGITTKYFKLVEGHEATIMTNVIGTFLLAFGILPKLRETALRYNTQMRLSIVASDTHFLAKFPEGRSKDIFAALNDEKIADMTGMERYSISKLLEVLVVRELAIRLASPDSTEPPVIVNCMTPGACKSDFNREGAGLAKIMFDVVCAIIARSTEVGSRTLVAALVAGIESHGGYMADSKVAEPGPNVLSAEGMKLQKKVWSQLVDELEAIQPGISRFFEDQEYLKKIIPI